jgi:hypothetical protein
MACNICENDYGLSMCDCTYLMCKTCANKHINIKKKDECPQCKKSIRRNHFFSGKISNLPPDELSVNRLYVYDDDKEPYGTRLFCSKHGIELQNEQQLIKYSEYKDKSKIDPIKLDNFSNSVGPFVLITPGIESAHGQFYLENSLLFPKEDFYHNLHGEEINQTLEDTSDEEDIEISKIYKDPKDILDIVIKRNKEMIKQCDIFTLKVNNENDCFCSYSEWGQAYFLNKYLILNIKKNNPKLKEYYIFAKQSIESLEKIDSFTKKEAIIQLNPEIEFYNYNAYKTFMEYIIQIK